MTIEELIDFVQQDITVSGALPKLIPDKEIRRLITGKAMPYFYENAYYAVEKSYLFAHHKSFSIDKTTGYSYLQLPCEVQNIAWVYGVTDHSLFQLGIAAPNLSVNLGVTNQPYLSSFTTTIGELAVYKVVIDYFADTLDMLSKHTYKFDYNFNNNRLHILTSMYESGRSAFGIKKNLILECFMQIAPEDLFEYELFRRYIIGLSKKQIATLVTRYNFELPGNISINGESLKADGDADILEVKETLTKEANTGFIIMTRK